MAVANADIGTCRWAISRIIERYCAQRKTLLHTGNDPPAAQVEFRSQGATSGRIVCSAQQLMSSLLTTQAQCSEQLRSRPRSPLDLIAALAVR